MKFWAGSHLRNQLEHRDTFDQDSWDNWIYYGYHRFIWVRIHTAIE